jgi:hypothetical protein
MLLARAIPKKSLWCSQSGNHSLEVLVKYFSTRYIWKQNKFKHPFMVMFGDLLEP